MQKEATDFKASVRRLLAHDETTRAKVQELKQLRDEGYFSEIDSEEDWPGRGRPMDNGLGA